MRDGVRCGYNEYLIAKAKDRLGPLQLHVTYGIGMHFFLRSYGAKVQRYR
jgi:hypothetical protein